MVKIKEIMKKHVVTAPTSVTLSDAAKIMTNNRIGSVVLVEKNKAVGIVTTEDITHAVAKGLDIKKTKIPGREKKKFLTAGPEDDLLKVTMLMVKAGIKRVPIVSGDKLVGIVTDKELLLTSPGLINVLSEKLKARISRVANPYEEISGICEECEDYSDSLVSVAGRWVCEECRE